VLVDYIGDEIMAMWGAPRPEPEHALLACEAARDMLRALPALNERWQEILGEPMDLGIGINTGIARVGNTGSRRKFKYGPLGDTVNVASRVQGANKYYRTRILLTRSCRDQLPEEITCRRIGPVRAVNLAEPVELFELPPDESPEWRSLRASYEEALEQFEGRRFREAARALGEMLISYPNDGPSVVLISRVAAALVDQSERFDPCFPLPGK
jgi:adenylate cyclase